MYEFNHNYYWFLALILALLIALCGFIIVSSAKAEELSVEALIGESAYISAPVPSVTVNALYRIVSGAMIKSDAPCDLQPVECVRLEMDTASLPEDVTLIDAELFFPALPKKLKAVLLYDGKQAVLANWHWTDENAIYVAFDRADIEKMDQTRPLYLFLFAEV